METTTEKMTPEQVDAAFAAVPLTFARYFKYSFTFTGTAPDGRTIIAVSGGDHNDIYRYEVEAGKPVPFGTCGDWKYVRVDGETLLFEASNF